MPRIIFLCTTLGASLTGLLTADEIPGWTDLTNVAKVSIIGFLCALIGLTLLMLLMANRNQQKDFIAEVQNSRTAYGQVIKDIRGVITDHLEANTQAIAGLAVQCAKSQTQNHADCQRTSIDSDRRHDDAELQHKDAELQHKDADRQHDAN